MNISDIEVKRRLDKVSIEKLASELGVSRQTYYNWIESKNIPSKFYNKACEVLGINQGQMTSQQPQSTVTQVDSDQFMEAAYLPISAQAGYLDSMESDNTIENLETMLIPKEFEKGNYLIVEISGDSMNDGSSRAIMSGDKLLCKELLRHHWSNKLHFKQYIFVIMSREGVVCKQITAHDIETGVITCHSWNELWKDYDVNLNDVYKLLYVKKIVDRKIVF